MGCCSGYGCDEFFGERFARRTSRRYREKGLEKTATRLRDLLAVRRGDAALEIGGGVGGLLAELVKAGAESGRLVEVVSGYEPFARAVFRHAGVEAEFVLADIVADPTAVEPAEVVALNKVVCCTPDGPQLVGAAAGLTLRRLAFSFPRERRSFALAARLQNLLFRLLRRRFRVFVHSRAALVGAAEGQGLRLVHERPGPFWVVVGFERA
ncbi:MAG: hypothetical protein MSC30_01680 [Gaiellaceae bacterium MAG52_C11]|nr:hypothetical protein [Candidatus Gaiellasilicea maunaloa]